MAAHVQHVVVIKFQEHTSDDQIAAFFADALEMTKHIPGITKFVHGPNCSPEGLTGDFTHAFIMSFESAAARDGYLPHDKHEEFKAKWLPSVEKIFVIDI
ncbi:hypothetical protein MNEG_3186 [Monoraphidium neglectum]|uniref:Stress-response A/B barrel domain-containing protein n=1 Tax=Monoraphidium neglectum TaxID=145388 RepID=A0A0D2LDI3_9CHLO|nr:hypothetical protein MNEG_3186 [Monoraphidium neglectum]KIZ04769.1 hypothetical protein MNEG_3186 [Monoraphidium neglectum]|eukprot:XP_013903788.1 hypothetical protein MNEG_3186 [Monoraphidium neglectum]